MLPCYPLPYYRVTLLSCCPVSLLSCYLTLVNCAKPTTEFKSVTLVWAYLPQGNVGTTSPLRTSTKYVSRFQLRHQTRLHVSAGTSSTKPIDISGWRGLWDSLTLWLRWSYQCWNKSSNTTTKFIALSSPKPFQSKLVSTQFGTR